MAISLLTRALARRATLDLETQATLRNAPLPEAVRVRTLSLHSGARDFSDQIIAVAMRQPAEQGDAVPTPDRVAAARSYLREAIADDAETYRQAASMDRIPATALAVGGVGMVAAGLLTLSGPPGWVVAASGVLAVTVGLYARTRANRLQQASSTETAALGRALAHIEQQ